MIDEKKLARYYVHYYEEERPRDVVVCGNREFALAERHHGVKETREGGLDATTRAVYFGAQRGKLLAKGESYQHFFEAVALIEDADAIDAVDAGDDEAGEVVERPESLAPLET